MDKKTMFKISYGLYVLTAKEEGFDNGCIINTVLQLTDNPLKICISVNKANKTHDMIKNTKEFCVSTISEDADFELFKHFGFQTGKEVNKFADFNDTKRTENGLYYITKGTNSYIEGKVVDMVDVGSHTLFIAEVKECEIISDKPSATYDYYHKNIKPKPDTSKKVKGYRCKICGYIYEGDTLPDDFVCPLCKHGADAFEKIE